MTARLIRRVLLGVFLGGAAMAAAEAQEEALRPQVGKPLQKARSDLGARRFAAAQHDVAVAEAVPGHSAYENYVILQMRAAIAQASGDVAGSIAADDQLIADGRTTAAEKTNLRMAEAATAYTAHDYPRAVTALQHYFAAGGRDPRMQTLLIQSYYEQRDWKDAEAAQSQQIAAIERAHGKPAENQLLLLSTVQQQAGDHAGFNDTMVQLVRYYPKPDYWAQLVHGLLTDPNTPDRLRLDIDRIRLAVGLLTSTADFTEMAELAIQQGRPVEGEQVIDKAYAAGAFGHDPAAAREAKLKAFAQAQAAQQKAGLASAVTAARAATTGEGLMQVGQQYVDAGNPQAGVGLMKEGLAKGGLPYPEEAQLHYGQALLVANDKAAAMAAWRSIAGPGVVRELAELWSLQAGA